MWFPLHIFYAHLYSNKADISPKFPTATNAVFISFGVRIFYKYYYDMKSYLRIYLLDGAESFLRS